MRIELQLVEFERGAYLPVPVAAVNNDAILINQLIGNQFAHAIGNRIEPVRPMAKAGEAGRQPRKMRQIDPSRGILRRQIVLAEDQTTQLPVIFEPTVQFEIAIR